jgi:hypothetical protein
MFLTTGTLGRRIPTEKTPKVMRRKEKSLIVLVISNDFIECKM